MIGIGETYTDLTISLHGGTYKNCKFQKCRLVFSGLQGTWFEGCEFGEDIIWDFQGPANNMVAFLKAFYASGGADLIENLFQHIKGQPTGPGPTPTFH